MLNNKKSQRSLILLIFVFIFNNIFLLSQQDFINNRPQLNAQFIDTNIIIDGEISSDLVWSNIKPITSLTPNDTKFWFSVSEDTQTD